jgi:protein subunit release factor A
MALAQSQEMRKAGNIKEGLALQRSAKKDYDATLAAIAQNEQNISELMTRERGMDRRTGAQITAQREDREAARAAETDYRNALIGLKREELGIKKMAEIAMIPDKEQREKALQEVLKSLAGGEEAMTGVEDLLAKYGR